MQALYLRPTCDVCLGINVHSHDCPEGEDTEFDEPECCASCGCELAEGEDGLCEACRQDSEQSKAR